MKKMREMGLIPQDWRDRTPFDKDGQVMEIKDAMFMDPKVNTHTEFLHHFHGQDNLSLVR